MNSDLITNRPPPRGGRLLLAELLSPSAVHKLRVDEEMGDDDELAVDDESGDDDELGDDNESRINDELRFDDEFAVDDE